MLSFPRREQTRCLVPLTALIDIIFLLLIYFLLTSNFIEQDSIDIRLPEVESLGIFHQKQLVVIVDKKGNYYIDNKIVPDKDLAETLSIWLRYSKTEKVLVKADRQVVYDRVVHLMDVAKKQGAAILLLATEPKK